MVALGGLLRREMEEGRDFLGKEQWTYRLPAAMARLMQCLVEEAEASPETLTGALQLIAIFAKGCNSKDNWAALSQGPYGEELLQQAWALYAPMKWRYETWLRNTIINLSVKRKPETYWQSEKGQAEIRSLCT